MRRYKNLSLFILIALLGFLSCSKHNYELGKLPGENDLNFDVLQDFDVDPGGNTVYLVNNSPETVPVWDYGTGKSNRQRDTIRFAFKGDYIIKYSAVTSGGLVEMPPVTVTVTEDNLNYVNDPLWTLLSGGVGNEKTWLLDANANGDKKFFTSPVYFAGQDNAYGSKSADGKTVEWTKNCTDPSGPNCWTYGPDYTSDTWAAEKRDYGSMTFSLKGGPFLQTDHKGVAGVETESGTYFLDINTLTLTTGNATPLSVGYTPSDVVSVYSWRILSLTENTMQLAVKNKSKAEYQVLNYISKSYSDSWTPPPPPAKQPDEGYNPVFEPGELLTMLTGGAQTGRFWTLDANGNPVDWVAKGNGWTTSKASSYNWGWNESWDNAVKNAWIRFDGGMNYTRFQDGQTTAGTFSIDETNNEITLTGNTLLQNASSWMNPTATKIKVVKAFDDYHAKGIWFGTNYDAVKDEWLVFHYIIP